MSKKKNNQQKSFDLEAVYDSEIAPLMSRIIDICKAHKLPMFATFLYLNDLEGEDGVCTTNLMFEERPIPEKLLQLAPMLIAHAPMMRMRVTKGDGSVEETMIVDSGDTLEPSCGCRETAKELGRGEHGNNEG